MPVRAKELRFEAELDAAGELTAEGCEPVQLDEPWTAEHLLLAAVLRCSLSSLRHHVRLAGLESRGGGSARGLITKRESDGRYAFVEVEVDLHVTIEPEAPEPIGDLLAKAERDCFISASLTVSPDYTWRVNGVTARAASAQV
jgi:organic hydroperoxide reductase OsmC/OhrA